MTTINLSNATVEVSIEPKKSITLMVDGVGRTFRIGDMAEYDSYNLSYYGTIVSITEKTVTIKEKYSPQKRRLKIYDFTWRNYDFDLAQTQAKNSETSMYI